MSTHPAARCIVLTFLLLMGLAPAVLAAQAQEEECTDCHDDPELHPSPVHSEVSCEKCHSNVESVPHRRRELIKLQGDEICLQCHEAPALSDHAESGCQECHGPPHETTTPEEGFCSDCHSRVPRTLGRSAHASEEITCQSCHGGVHSVLTPDDAGSRLSAVNQIQTCGQCHEPVMDGYLTSEHARALLVAGLIHAPACTDCHGGHQIRPHEEPSSATSHQNSPDTCGGCHGLIMAQWTEQSAHGMAWQNDGEGPVCSTCHQAHAVQEPARGEKRLAFPADCGNCHGELYSSFRVGFHGQATALGHRAAATCADCHRPHRDLPADDPRSSVHPDNLDETCGQCHSSVNAAFLSFDPHNDPSDPEDNPKVYYVYIFMLLLLLGVFTFFAAHDLLWLQRTAVAGMRGELKEMRSTEGPYVKRFSKLQTRTHMVVVVSFLLLAATGLPLRFPEAPWAQPLVNLFGGVETAGLLHRIAGVVTFGYFFLHVLHVLYGMVVKRKGGYLWGPHSMVPQPQDVRDFWANIKYFLYLGPRPATGRWTYWEKFDYLAVFWGVVIIGTSGLMLWFPEFFTRFLPGWTLNAAFVVHSEEALLATGFIFIFHFFHVNLRPESFPMDPVIFTGVMPLARFKEERPLEYERLVENGRLEERLVEKPGRPTMRKVYLFGLTAMTIGLLLAAAIFWALLGKF